MSEQEEPPWDRLPGDPLGFFGLAAGFDPQELRRRYGRLIKRFRPDRDPGAFQRIRAAYEALQPSTVQASTSAAGLPSPQAAPPALVDALRSVLAAESPLAGLELALAALLDAPSDPRLLALLAGVASDVPAPDAERALRGLAQRLSPPEFLRVSPELWRRWLREADPARFEATWTELMAGPASGREGVPSLLSILRSAALRLSDRWIDDAVTRLGDATEGEGLGVEQELELVRMLRVYRAVRPLFIAGGDPFRSRFDQVLVDMIDRRPGAQRAMFELLGELQDDPRPALAALRPGDPAADMAVVALSWLIDDLTLQGRTAISVPVAPDADERGNARLVAVAGSPTGRLGLAVVLITSAFLIGLLVQENYLRLRLALLACLLVGVGQGQRSFASLFGFVRSWIDRREPIPRRREGVAALIAWGAADVPDEGSGLDAALLGRLRGDPALRLVALSRKVSCA